MSYLLESVNLDHARLFEGCVIKEIQPEARTAPETVRLEIQWIPETRTPEEIDEDYVDEDFGQKTSETPSVSQDT